MRSAAGLRPIRHEVGERLADARPRNLRPDTMSIGRLQGQKLGGRGGV